MKKTTELVRSGLLALLGNPGVYALMAFMVTGMFTPGKLGMYRGWIELNVLVPWGLALAIVHLVCRVKRGRQPVRWDIAVLLVLFVWLLVPFMLRFGLTQNNIYSWQNHAIIFFGVYALGSSMEEKKLGKGMDLAGALGAVITFVFCGALLLAAAMGLGSDNPAEFGFGVYLKAHLCSGAHYNTTGMLAMCASFFCLMGVCRAKGKLAKAAHLIPALMAMVVTVLSQSRTARYSLLAGLAVGCYGMVASGRWHPKKLVRHAAGVLAACVVLVGGYLAASGLTNAALRFYVQEKPWVAIAEETEPAQQEQNAPQKARGMGEGTFTGRTDVWKNIFKLWREKPKYMLIGNGMGRTSRDILIGTPLEGVGANQAHNTYLQFILDYGLIGFVLLCLFFLLIVPQVWRVFFAAPGTASAGTRALCMLVVGCLMTGMMESDPLGAMRPSNVMLFYALACISGAGRNIKK